MVAILSFLVSCSPSEGQGRSLYGCHDDTLAYKIARNKTNKMVEKAKSRHFQHTINNNSNDPNNYGKVSTSLEVKDQKQLIISLEVEEETITGNKNIAEALNSFFVNVGLLLSKELPESQNNYADYLQYSTQNAFTFDEVSENDTLKLLCSLKELKSTGPDKINARLVKETQLNIQPDKIYRWLVANKLTLNVSKMEYMIIGSCHNLGKTR